jgi:histidinol-phosphate aminotransferase
LSLLPKTEIQNISNGIHGGPDYTELKSLGLDSERILDFSVCCNPYNAPRTVRDSLRNLNLKAYPDSQASELRLKIARKYGITTENILAGNGTTELIRLIASTYFNKGEKVLIPVPTYGEYETSSRLAGANIIEYHWKRLETSRLDVCDLVEAIGKESPKAVFLGNPNNPSGDYLKRDEMEKIAACLKDTLLIIDEAYINFVKEGQTAMPLIENGKTIILRSMTKDYGLAGLRLGYTVASVEIITNLRRVCPPWNVNIAAQKSGAAALEAENFLVQSIKKIRQSKEYLVGELAKLGYEVLPSTANFFLVKVKSGKSFRTALLSEGILVRDCTSFGMPEYIRIAPGTKEECRKLIKTIKKLKNEGRLNDND